jgi:hypothetical protein
MLKIKDNIDLKELEKFGFVCVCDRYVNEYIDEEQGYSSEEVRVQIDSRVIYYSTMWDIAQNSLDIIYSLIKADLVEKVENDGN